MTDTDTSSNTDTVTNEPVLHVIVVGFHHKKGCQVEYSYPPLIEGNSVESHEIPLEWKNIPSLALPDGAHNYVKDTVYFLLPGRQGNLQTVYGVSCYRQMDAKDLINKTADVTRSTVQKSVCVLSRLPLFGLIKAKLELITHAYFDERDFSQVALLEQTYNNLNASLNHSLLEGTQVFLDLPVRQLVTTYKHKVLILFKLMLLERRVLVFGSPVEALCQTHLGVVSLFPGMLENGLAQACNQWNKILSPTLSLANIDDDQDEDDQFLEVHYHSVDNNVPYSENTTEELGRPQVSSKEAPVAPTIPRDPILLQSSGSEKKKNHVDSTPPKRSSQTDPEQIVLTSNCDAKTSSTDRTDFTRSNSLNLPNSSDIDISQSPKNLVRRSVSNDSDKLSVHVPHRSKKDSLTDSELKQDEAASSEESPLAHISEITHIEAVQSGIETINIISSQQEGTASRMPKNSLTLAGTKPLRGTRTSIEELDSPESLLEIDNEDCFSWEQDGLQLTLHEDVEDNVSTEKENSLAETPSEQGLKLSISMSESKESLDLDGSGRESISSDSTSTRTSPSNPSGKKKKGKVDSPKRKAAMIKGKLSAAFTKKAKEKISENSSIDQRMEGEVILKQDKYGHPLAIFASGSVLYPYLSLQYHDILTDVNTRSFTIGATNVLFKQRRQLIDVLVEIDDGKIEIRDKELQRQLHLTTADLRFAEYLVKAVTEDDGSFVDGTEWEGSEEWIRAQFKFYINSLLATVMQDDPKLLEDFGVTFLSAWKTTYNFRHWQKQAHPVLNDIATGHPFQGNLSVSDVRNRFNHAFQNTERGKKINAAVVQTGKYVVQTGKAVGGALTSAKSAVSGWFSSWRTSSNKPQDREDKGDKEEGEEELGQGEISPYGEEKTNTEEQL